MGKTTHMSSHGALPFRIRSAVEIVEVRCNVSSTGLDQGKLGTLKEANKVIETTSIGINRFWGFLQFAQKEDPLSRMHLSGNARIELPSYLIHVEDLPDTRCNALQDGKDGTQNTCSILPIVAQYTHTFVRENTDSS